MKAPKKNPLPKQKTSTANAIFNNSLDVAKKKVVEEVQTTLNIDTPVLVRTCINKLIVKTTFNLLF